MEWMRKTHQNREEYLNLSWLVEAIIFRKSIITLHFHAYTMDQVLVARCCVRQLMLLAKSSKNLRKEEKEMHKGTESMKKDER